MKNLMTKAIAASLSALMAVSTIGATSVCAAETTQEPTMTTALQTAAETVNPATLTRTYYFTDVHDWGSWGNPIYCFAYDNEGGNTIEDMGAYPGAPLAKVGSTNLIDGEYHDVYSVKIPVTVDAFCFNNGVKEDRNTKMDLPNRFYDGANMVYYTDDMYPEVRHFDESDLRTDANTIYFQNTKDWEDVYAYTVVYAMDAEGKYLKDENGKNIVVEETNGAWPGKKLDEVIGSGYDYFDGKNHNVYPVSVHEGDSIVVFSEGKDHGQQSSDVNIQYIWGGANLISLDQNNVGSLGHFNNYFIEHLDPAI